MSRRAGSIAENTAASFLQKHGLKLLIQNYQCKMGEIDLIMQDGQELVFVEVRARSNTDYGHAAETITQRKQTKVIKAAKHFLLSNHNSDLPPCRFDIFEFNDSENQKTNWIKDAFQLNGFSIL